MDPIILAYFFIYRRPTRVLATTFPGPVASKTFAVPTHNRIGVECVHHCPPSVDVFRKQDPKHSQSREIGLRCWQWETIAAQPMASATMVATYPSWSGHLSQAIKALGSSDFFALLSRAFCHLPNVSNPLLIFFPECGRPQALFSNYTEKDEYQRQVGHYMEGTYVLDPYYNASLNDIKAGAYQLKDVAPDNFKRSEYYRVFYKATDIVDEVTFLQQLPDGGHLHLSFAYLGAQAHMPANIVRFLKSWAEVINSLLLRHWQLFSAENVVPEAESFHRQLQQALGVFGSSVLTDREQSILQLILRGHSNKSASMRLHIAESTVKLHRKHMYQKFDISSQSELFHLFIDSLSCFNPGEDKDPLQSYMHLAG